MKLLSIVCGAFCVFTALSAHADNSLNSFKITFQTTDCSGQSGIASVDIDRIDKIQPINCPPPTRLLLKQILVKSGPGLASFDAYTVTEEESAHVQRQIDRYMQAREKTLERSRPIIIEH
ncbi:MAG: hypothetical protein ACYDDO_04030 [Acidiferrobacterales bacterium]